MGFVVCPATSGVLCAASFTSVPTAYKLANTLFKMSDARPVVLYHPISLLHRVSYGPPTKFKCGRCPVDGARDAKTHLPEVITHGAAFMGRIAARGRLERILGHSPLFHESRVGIAMRKL